MRAAFVRQPGPPESIEFAELPTPHPGPGEALVRVLASALNPIDLYLRAGSVPMALPWPYVPGCDLAGVVESVGPDVHRIAPGQRVWGSNQGLMGRQGTLAEYAAVHEDWLYPVPEGVAETDAAAVALVGITAHLGLFRCARLEEGETVFVNGGTGGVGSMVVQMARAVGARVAATVGSAEKAELCRDLGAETVINYKTDDVAERVREFSGGAGVQVWFETQREPDFERTVPLLARRGRMVVMAGRQAKPAFPVGPFYTRDLSLHGFAMFNATPDEQRTCAADIERWLEEGRVKAVVGKSFPLSDAAEAHKFLEDNTLRGAGTLTGKVLVVL